MTYVRASVGIGDRRWRTVGERHDKNKLRDISSPPLVRGDIIYREQGRGGFLGLQILYLRGILAALLFRCHWSKSMAETRGAERSGVERWRNSARVSCAEVTSSAGFSRMRYYANARKRLRKGAALCRNTAGCFARKPLPFRSREIRSLARLSRIKVDARER